MKWLCKIFGHKFGGFLLKTEEGELINPPIYELPAHGRIDVYKKCERCEDIYDQSWWGVIFQSSKERTKK